MEAAFFVMAIMGCGDGSTACTQARVEPVRYATIQQCQAAMPDVLADNTDIEFPVVSATCRGNGLRMADRAGSGPRG